MNLFQKYKKLLLLQFIAPVGGLIAGLFSYSFKSEFIKIESSDASFIFDLLFGLSGALLFYTFKNPLLIAFNIDDVRGDFDKKIDREVEKFERLLEQKSRVQLLNREDIDRVIQPILENSDTVQNSYINISDVNGPHDRRGRDVIKWYEQFLDSERHVKWIDVVGVKDFKSERYHQINLENADRNSKHELHIIENERPIINFLVLGKGHKKTDVFFGWLRIDQSMRVYRSRDENLIKMFSSHFDELTKSAIACVEVDYSKSDGQQRFSNLFIESVEGTWVGARHPIEGVLPKHFFTLQVEFVDGTWKVNGGVYRYNNREKVYRIQHEYAALFEDELRYRFKLIEKAASLNGSGSLRISDNVLEGSFVNYVAGDQKSRPYSAYKVSDSAIEYEDGVRTVFEEALQNFNFRN